VISFVLQLKKSRRKGSLRDHLFVLIVVVGVAVAAAREEGEGGGIFDLDFELIWLIMV